jgi:hypothetical protein
VLKELNIRLEEVREQLLNKEKREARLKSLENRRKELEHQSAMWKQQLAEEEADVERLSGLTFSNLWYTVTGKKDGKLQSEEAEVLEAKLKYDQSVHSLAEMAVELEGIKERLQAAKIADAEYRSLLLQKEQLILKNYPALAGRLADLADKKEEAAAALKEWREAIYEGKAALQALTDALKSLDSAHGWGVYDMLGGGMISTKIKHGHMDDAIRHVQRAAVSLERFRRELEDIRLDLSVEPLNLDGFLRFSDYLFDGLLADYAVQGRIKEARSRLTENTAAIDSLIRRLETEARKCESDMAQLGRQYDSLIETSEG